MSSDEDATLLYQGLLASPASWGRVGRELVRAFMAHGVSTAAVRTRGFGYDESFPLPAGLTLVSAAKARARPPPPYGLGFLHPPLLDRLIGRQKANLFVWEADRIPSAWGQFLDEHVDRVVVPSRFTGSAVREHLPTERILEIPYGYDPTWVSSTRAIRAARPASAPYTFLAVVAPHWRKGVRELLLAYRRSFTARDQVLLRLKTTYDPGRAKRRFPFEIRSWAALLADCGLNQGDAPPIDLRVGNATDAELAQHYADADVFVSPSWGESFGLAALDAMASGLPTLVTGWSGLAEIHPGGDDCLPYRLVDAESVHGVYVSVPGARVAQPDIDALAARLRWHHEHRAASHAEGDRVRTHGAPWTWARCAHTLLTRWGVVSDCRERSTPILAENATRTEPERGGSA